MFKSLLVFVHLLAFAWAFAPIARADLMMWRHRHHPLNRQQLQRMGETERDAIFALGLLWASGLALVGLGYATEGAAYLANEKLWVKFAVVIALTLNGLALHLKAFPLLKRGVAFVALPLRARLLAAALGAVSGSSWIFAAYLGIARYLNHTAPFTEVFAAYLAVVAGAVAVALLSQWRPQRGISFAR